MLFGWLRRSSRARCRGGRRPAGRGSARPRLEGLECRALPSVVFHEFLIPTAASNPRGLAGGPDGNVWFTEESANNIAHVSPAGQFVEVVLPNAGSNPFEITAGPDGNMWFTEQAGNRIGRITPAGVVTEFTVPTLASGPTGITAGPDGNLWFTEQTAGKIGRVTTSGTITEFALPNAAAAPFEITRGPDGNLWFTEQAANAVGRISTAGVITEFALPTGPAANSPWGITPAADGNLWFTESGSSQIGRITPSGTVTVFATPTPAAGPRGISMAADGNLWVAENNVDKLAKVSLAGAVTEFALPTLNGFPSNVAAGPNGNLWFNESNANKIGEVVTPNFLVTGPDQNGGPDVRVFDPTTGTLERNFLAYASGFLGGVRVALGDVNRDGIPDIITAPGPSGGPDVRIYDGRTGVLLRGILAYPSAYTAGVYVASADINGDGMADIVTGTDVGGLPQVNVYSGKDGSLLQAFFAYATGFTGGVRVATGDVTGLGRPEIITAAGPGGGPHVKVFSPTVSGQQLAGFMAYDTGFMGGVYVAVGDVNGDGTGDIVTGAGAGGGPNVRVFSGPSLTLTQNFMAYPVGYTGGVRVAADDVTGDGAADIVVAPGAASVPQVQVYDGKTLAVIDSFFAYSQAFGGGVFVGG